MRQTFIMHAIRFCFVDFIGDVFYFPVWWYSKGLAKVIFFVGRKIRDRERSLALFVWIKNLFVPMYAQYNWQGMIISFVMRLIQIVFRLAVMVIWVAIMGLLIMVWITLPIFVVYQALVHAGSVSQIQNPLQGMPYGRF